VGRTHTRRNAWGSWLAQLLALLVLSGCASTLAPLVPQTYALRTGWPEGVPRQAELTRVPFFEQLDFQCGPAALATVLQASGVAITPDPLVEQVWIPSRKGSLQVEMLAAPRRYGRVSYKLASSYSDLLREVAGGNPVVVLQDVGPVATQWHYAVVVGYDYDRGSIFLRSGDQPRFEMSFTAFERSWLHSGYWAMVVTPPDKPPVTATADRWLDAVNAFARAAPAQDARAAYAAALQRWPDSLPAAIGLANQWHAAKQLDQAEAVLRQALVRHPQSVIAMNNLAHTLSDRGRHQEALQVLDKAQDTQGPFAAEVRSTRQLVQERMRAQRTSSAR
jgi:hypothetical protein